LTVRGLTDYLDALLLEQIAQTGPEEVVVVNEQNPQAVGLALALLGHAASPLAAVRS
jgi:hypothetical protein